MTIPSLDHRMPVSLTVKTEDCTAHGWAPVVFAMMPHMSEELMTTTDLDHVLNPSISHLWCLLLRVLQVTIKFHGAEEPQPLNLVLFIDPDCEYKVHEIAPQVFVVIINVHHSCMLSITTSECLSNCSSTMPYLPFLPISSFISWCLRTWLGATRLEVHTSLLLCLGHHLIIRSCISECWSSYFAQGSGYLLDTHHVHWSAFS